MNLAATGRDRTALELKMYFREKEAVVFSFLFPILMLGLFAVVFTDINDGQGADHVNGARFFLPGLIAGGVMLTSFQTLAITIATERDDGTLKWLRGTPMPPMGYFLGKIGLVAATSLAQLAILLLTARLLFDVPMPADAGRWLTLAWVFLLGVAGGSVLGIAFSSVAGSARSATGVVIGPLLLLQFISGVYFAFDDLPGWLKDIASVFPLKWVAQGTRSVFLPEGWQAREMAGSWEHGRILMVLVVWLVVGLVLCARTFQWQRRDGG